VRVEIILGRHSSPPSERSHSFWPPRSRFLNAAIGQWCVIRLDGT
jgi:hypothetical protein